MYFHEVMNSDFNLQYDQIFIRFAYATLSNLDSNMTLLRTMGVEGTLGQCLSS